MNKNVWHTLESYLCMQGSLVQDNGHSLVPVLRKSGTPSKRTVHKESGTILRRRFSDSVLCLGKILENTQSNDAWEQRL